VPLQFTKSLQWIDAHGMEYVERLKDESVLYSALAQAQQWFEHTSANSNVARVVLRRLEHIYSKVRELRERAKQGRTGR
jgi:translation initiation factor 3 subunit C